MSKSLSPSPRRPIREQAATLVVTLLVMTLLSTIVIAFMQNVSSERNTSRSHVSRYQAELAAEAGLAVFLSNLANATQSGDFQVLALTANSSNQTFTAITKFDGNGTMSVLPLSSTNNSTQAIVSTPYTISQIHAAVSALFPAGNMTLNMKTVLTGLADIEYATSNNTNLSFPSQLATVPSTGNATTMEYAYVAVDECAKLNIALFGGNSSANPRIELTTGEFPKFVPVAGVGNHTVTTAQFESFNTITPPSSKMGPLWVSIYDNLQNRKDKNRFYSFHKGELIDFIPAGYWSDNGSTWTAYPDAGKPKFDLNQMATTNSTATDKANSIAFVISKNLVNFHMRDPSFANEKNSPAIIVPTLVLKVPSEPDQLYNKRIAASIVDYIDPDSAPTGVTDDLLAGKEQTPYVMQVAERFVWQGSSSNSTTGTNTITIEHTVYIQIWNPYSVSVNGTLGFELETYRRVTNQYASDPKVSIPPISRSFSVSLRPNEIECFLVDSQFFTIDSPALTLELEQTKASTIPLLNTAQNSGFKTSWNGAAYDQSAFYNSTLFPFASGFDKALVNLTPSNSAISPLWSCNLISTSRSPTGWPNTVLRFVGDPRQNQISNYTWQAASYSNADVRWNGASNHAENSQFTQRFHNTWLNRDAIRQSAKLHVGNAPSNSSTVPSSIAKTYDASASGDAIDAPFFLRNGNMTSPAELGHIYDPAHLSDSGVSGTGGGSSGNASSYYAFGGGRSLRIGQPEFRYATYDLAGQRAVSLLDLFTVNSTSSDGKRPSGVNLNSAPQEVLSTFFYNIAQTADKGQNATAESPYALSMAGAESIASRIIAGRPYYNAADFWKFSDTFTTAANYSPPFPTTQPTSPTNTPPTLDVMDRGREEVFRRAYNYLETKSGAFRFYGIGRVAQNGAVVSQVALEALVELKGSVDSAGKPLLKPVIVWKKTL